jgi:micrococcal nuclease
MSVLSDLERTREVTMTEIKIIPARRIPRRRGGGIRNLRWFLLCLSVLATIAYVNRDRYLSAAPIRYERKFSICGSAARVNCVVDGDTMWLDGVKIRIADIDAPEIHPPRCELEEKLGLAAQLRLQAELNVGPFLLNPVERDEDKYGRKLRIIARDGRSVGMTLVSEGLARAWNGRREPWCP